MCGKAEAHTQAWVRSDVLLVRTKASQTSFLKCPNGLGKERKGPVFSLSVIEPECVSVGRLSNIISSDSLSVLPTHPLSYLMKDQRGK